MKKTLLIILITVIAAGFAGAGGLDMHFGLGYNAQYFGDYEGLTDGEATWMPYGIGAYGGFGYGFGARKVFNIGLEPAVAMGVNFNDAVSIANIELQGRAYLKLKPAKFFTLAAYGGITWDSYGGTVNSESFSFNDYGMVVGGRLTLLFLYAQYDVTVYHEDGLPLRHNFGAGFALKK